MLNPKCTDQELLVRWTRIAGQTRVTWTKEPSKHIPGVSLEFLYEIATLNPHVALVNLHSKSSVTGC